MDTLAEALMGGQEEHEEGIGKALVASINGLAEQVGKQTETVGSLRERVASQEQSTKSLWHEVRGLGDKIDRKFDSLPDAINGAVKDHADDCIAREKARKRATEKDSDPTIPRPPQYGGPGYVGSPDDSQVVELQRGAAVLTNDSGLRVPSKVVWIGIGGGVTLAVAVWLLSALGVLPSF